MNEIFSTMEHKFNSNYHGKTMKAINTIFLINTALLFFVGYEIGCKLVILQYHNGFNKFHLKKLKNYSQYLLYN